MEAMRKLQVDYTSLPAGLVPLVLNLQFEGLSERAQKEFTKLEFRTATNNKGQRFTLHLKSNYLNGHSKSLFLNKRRNTFGRYN